MPVSPGVHGRTIDFMDQEPSYKGLVYRSSDLVETVVNRREAAVIGGHLATYRREGDAKPTKVWSLRGAKVEPPKEVECEIKAKGTSTLVAVIAGKYKKQQLHGVKLRFESADPLTIYTASSAEAQSWYTELTRAVGQAAVDAAASASSHLAAGDSNVSAYRVSGSVSGGPDHGPGGSSSGGRAQHRSRYIPPESESARATAQRSSSVPKRKVKGRWASLMHVNGTAVYLEQEGPQGSGGALMASLVVRAYPADVFDAMMEAYLVAEPSISSVNLLEKVSDHKAVFRMVMQPEGGLLGYCSAPREVVISRTWRFDDEGAYVILYQSTEHEKAPEQPPSAFSWRQPIRMTIPAAGITVSPLQRQYTHGDGESPESLLTLVLKADPGGWLGGSLLTSLFGPTAIQIAAVRPFVMAMIATRDRVEQERFLIQPLEFAEGDEADGESRTTQDVLEYNFRTKSLLQARLIQDEMGKLTPEQAAAEMAESPGRALRQYADGTCPSKYWSCPGAAGFRLRGPNYLQDRKKVDAKEPVFSLVAVDLIRTREKSLHIAPQLPSLKLSDAPFTFVFNLMVTGPPHLSLVVSWAAEYDPSAMASIRDDVSVSVAGDNSDDEELAEMNPVDRALIRFLAGDDTTRNGYLKLIPKMVQASWIIKQAVGSTPVILGRKLTTHYTKGSLDDSRQYMEVDVDIGSSSAASGVVGLVQPATKSIVMDIAVLLEGHHKDELPEGLLGTVRLSSLDLAEYKYLVRETGEVYSREEAPPEVRAWK